MANEKQIAAIIGTYTGEVYAFELSKKGIVVHLENTFKEKPYGSLIKCVSAQNGFFATGGPDDKAHIYSLEKRQLLHELYPHTGSVTAMAIAPNLTHLLTGGEDGVICATDMKTFKKAAQWERIHKGAKILDLSFDPSSSLLLSLGADSVLCTWDMARAHVAYRTNLKSRSALGATAESLQWSSNGNYFSICGPNIIEIRSFGNASVVLTCNSEIAYTCLAWVSDSVAIAGKEDGTLAWISVDSEKDVYYNKLAHETRVKAISYIAGVLVSVDSAGCIKFWKVDDIRFDLCLLAAADIPRRPISLATTIVDRRTGDSRQTKRARDKSPMDGKREHDDSDDDEIKRTSAVRRRPAKQARESDRENSSNRNDEDEGAAGGNDERSPGDGGGDDNNDDKGNKDDKNEDDDDEDDDDKDNDGKDDDDEDDDDEDDDDEDDDDEDDDDKDENGKKDDDEDKGEDNDDYNDGGDDDSKDANKDEVLVDKVPKDDEDSKSTDDDEVMVEEVPNDDDDDDDDNEAELTDTAYYEENESDDDEYESGDDEYESGEDENVKINIKKKNGYYGDDV